MIGVSKLLCDLESESDGLRYGINNNQILKQIKHHPINVKSNKPIVIWNVTNKCNLNCLHCYATAMVESNNKELSTEEGMHFLDSLADYKVPVVIFSGGEPFLRPDLFELIEYANSIGLRPVISTNGTLIDKKKAEIAKSVGVKYIGVSLDGLENTNDKFRGVSGAFQNAVIGMRNSIKAGIKTGLRFTLTRHNHRDIPGVLLNLKEIGVNRCCVYHLDYCGRGKDIVKQDLNPKVAREAINSYFELTRNHHANGYNIETLLVGNYCDAGFLYLKLLKDDPERAKWAYNLLKENGGDGTGETIAAVDPFGFVHANQFWQDYSFGSIRDRSFGEIWEDTSDPIMLGLKNKNKYITGRCAADNCRFFEICKGGSRVRALVGSGDIWASDPACYLTNNEIAKEQL
ncbi:MAG: radical SAM protein [Candidatus Bathyarchaeota archaeon]|nr:radical SAM protein [Candidatus Bathyarchaeum tardum]